MWFTESEFLRCWNNESSSSKNMTHGALSEARWNTCLTARSLSPTYYMTCLLCSNCQTAYHSVATLFVKQARLFLFLSNLRPFSWGIKMNVKKLKDFSRTFKQLQVCFNQPIPPPFSPRSQPHTLCWTVTLCNNKHFWAHLASTFKCLEKCQSFPSTFKEGWPPDTDIA